MLPWHDTGIYDNPNDFELTLVRDVDIADSYEFDIVGIWKTSDGRHLIGHDSGCSCPTPFENTRVDELTEVHTLAEVADFARAKWGEWHVYDRVEDRVARLVSSLDLG